jgi:hypothetical protein
MPTFLVKTRTYSYSGSVCTSIQCAGGPIFVNMTRLRLYRAGTAGDVTSGTLDKNSALGTIVLSQAEFEAVRAAVDPAAPSNPVAITLQCIDQANPRYTDVQHAWPGAIQGGLFQIQSDVSTISALTAVINDRLEKDPSGGVVTEMRKLNGLVKAGLRKLGVPEHELLAIEESELEERASEAKSYPPFERLGTNELDVEFDKRLGKKLG